MLKRLKDNKLGIALYMVLGTIVIITILANIVLRLVSSQSRLTHHQISRIKAYYAAQAGLNYTLELLRLGKVTVPDEGSDPAYVCLNGCIDANMMTANMHSDADIPYNVQVAINPANSGINTTARIEIAVDYTYTP